MNKLSIREFIKRAQDLHGHKYDYSKFKYITSKTNSIIICPLHGEYFQSADSHINKGSGCLICWGRDSKTIKTFIEQANKIHNNFYDYSKFVYSKAINKSIIICPIHGEFKQSAHNHVTGQGCPVCRYIKSSNKFRKTKEIFIKESLNVFGNLYDYKLVDYKNGHTKVKIKCKIHGYFLKTPVKHLKGQGCPKCSSKSNGEKLIEKFFIKNRIYFIPQKKFDTCSNKFYLPFDFYIPKLKLLIEYDGRQHFGVNSIFCKNGNLDKIKTNDKIKTKWAKENGYKLLRIPYTKFNKIEEILNATFKD